MLKGTQEIASFTSPRTMATFLRFVQTKAPAGTTYEIHPPLPEGVIER